jgi:predicted RNase H-like nuclease (RuvC/YqgF family)
LDEGRLKGPTFVGRAPKGAGRITRESVDAYKAVRDERIGATRNTAGRRGEPELSLLQSEVGELRRHLSLLENDLRTLQRRQEAAQTGLLEMKVAADRAREAARAERRINRRLTDELARLTALVGDVQAQTDQTDDIAEAYSSALSELLLPGDTSSIGRTEAR